MIQIFYLLKNNHPPNFQTKFSSPPYGGGGGGEAKKGVHHAW